MDRFPQHATQSSRRLIAGRRFVYLFALVATRVLRYTRATMRFERDEEKNRINIRKHGLSLADGWKMFNAPMLTRLDDREEYGEERWIAIGLLDACVVVMIYTERGQDSIRIISLRKAKTYERKQYEQAFSNRLAAG